MEKTPIQNHSDPDLLFKPLTEGLGFHPFSDGLPYAPIGKSNKQNFNATSQVMGSGAVAAGPPKFSPAAAALAARSPSIPKISVPVASSVEIGAESVKHRSSPATRAVGEFSFAYIGKRVTAYIFDSMISAIICILTAGFMIWIQDINSESIQDSSIILGFGLFIFGFQWSWVMVQEVLFKTTLGKRLFGLNFRASSIVLFLRALFFIPSVSFLAIGILWGLFDPQKRCLHDRLSGVQPIDLVRL